MKKTLAAKIERVLSDPNCRDFILADAKDADMAYGLSAPGVVEGDGSTPTRLRTIDEFRDHMREIVAQQLVDIMLMSVSSSDQLTIRDRLFDDSPVTPAIRANDTTDIWLAGGVGGYGAHPSRPFATATIDQAMCGRISCEDSQRGQGADLGLYSMTFTGDIQLDLATLEAYKAFRAAAETKGFRHFLEVFTPNAGPMCGSPDVPQFVNDSIVRALAGVPSASRPLFLKIPYFGPAEMEQLAAYDRSLIVGILGGSAGTSRDAFQLLHDAKKYGARAALFGRKINNAEHQPSFVKCLRQVADDELEPVEAVNKYHGALKELGRRPKRSLEEDLQSTPAGVG